MFDMYAHMINLAVSNSLALSLSLSLSFSLSLSLSLSQLAPAGVPCALLGIAYMAIASKYILPDTQTNAQTHTLKGNTHTQTNENGDKEEKKSAHTHTNKHKNTHTHTNGDDRVPLIRTNDNTNTYTSAHTLSEAKTHTQTHTHTRTHRRANTSTQRLYMSCFCVEKGENLDGMVLQGSELSQLDGMRE